MDFDDISTPLAGRLADTLRRIASATRSADWAGRREHGLHPAQRALLEVLARAVDGLRLVDLAAQLKVSKATVSVSVDALEARGLVVRVANPHDARSRLVRLSRLGRGVLAKSALAEDPVAAAFDSLDAAERAVVNGIALKVVRHLQQSGRLPSASMCLTCCHFEPWRHPGTDRPHHCHYVESPMADRHLRLHCAEHDPADAEHQALAWERFVHPEDAA